MREALLRGSGQGLGNQTDGGNRGMHENFHRIGDYRMSRGCDIGRGVGQAAGRGQRTGRAADSVVGDAAARVPVPRASAQNAGRRDVHQLVVGGAVGVCGHGGRRALAGNGRRRGELSRLSVGQGDTGGGGGERDRGHIRDLHPVTQAIAVVHARVAGAAGDRNPGRNGQAQQTNKRQKPPHETSPPRLVEPRNGLFRTHRRFGLSRTFPRCRRLRRQLNSQAD